MSERTLRREAAWETVRREAHLGGEFFKQVEQGSALLHASLDALLHRLTYQATMPGSARQLSCTQWPPLLHVQLCTVRVR